VEREFARYLECGVLAHGFARVRCESCKVNTRRPPSSRSLTRSRH